jgi:aryl-alcohol dehydrogenase-like predicted oxidoreductase
MEYRPLGNSDLKVSSLCLGTMTWGNQNSAEEGFAQMDLALDRGINFFDTAEMYAVPIAETVAALKKLVDSGKIRHWGLSNETAWGTMAFIREAEKIGLAPPVSIQNPYSLLNRSFEVGLAEVAHRENVGLLAYSPLAFGMLTGKYRGGQWPANARLTLFKHFARYTNDQATDATEAYCRLAEERGVSPTHLALQFVTTRPFVTSNIIGATNLNQLRENLDSVDMAWDKDLEKELEAIHTRFPYPAP